MNAQVQPMAVQGRAWLVEVAHQERVSGGYTRECYAQRVHTYESHALLPPATHSACFLHGDRWKCC